MRSEWYLGLMSGTSQDRIDGVLLEVGGRDRCTVATHGSRAYPPRLRRELLAVAAGQTAITPGQLARLDHDVGSEFAKTALAVLKKARQPASSIRAIGCHGQTVFHDPRGARSSLQLGDPNLVAARTGITTVADFRRADIAVGGQGAPLVPAFHAAVFGARRESRVVLNLGGIANITVLPRTGAVTGFDTGPANALLDEWCELKRGESFDRNGRWAATGTVIPEMLERLLTDPYLRRLPPKSTGRDYFNLAWLRARYPASAKARAGDVQRTLLEFTARSVAQAIARHAPDARRLLVCGGGVQNQFLMSRLAALLAAPLESTTKHGIPPQAVEAAAFAWLAMRTLRGKTGNLPSVTGARQAAILGGTYLPPLA